MLTTLATFNGANGANPFAALVIDAAGNLYGTTQYGGANNNGTVFQVAAGTRALSTLATFNLTNGRSPGVLIADGAGNLYGTTAFGGPNDTGTVHQIAAGTRALSTLAMGKPAIASTVFTALTDDADCDCSPDCTSDP